MAAAGTTPTTNRDSLWVVVIAERGRRAMQSTECGRMDADLAVDLTSFQLCNRRGDTETPIVDSPAMSA